MILIVEDDLNMQATLIKLAETCNFKALGCRDVEGLQEALNETTPNLIILDVGLPGTDGLSILKNLRASPRFKELPVVMISGHADLAEFNVSHKAKEFGCSDFIYKPFKAQEVIAAIEKYAIKPEGHGDQEAPVGSETPEEAVENTEEVEATEEVEPPSMEASDEQSELSKAKGRRAFAKSFIRKVSHDLKNPVGAITGLVDCMLMGLDGEINGEQKASLQKIASSCNKLVSMIHEVVEIFKLKIAEDSLSISECDVRDVVDAAVASVEGDALAKGLSLETHFPEETEELLADVDSKKIIQVMEHLLHNAITHSSSGIISVKVSEENHMVEIAVQDPGAGLNPDELAAISSSFVKEDEQAHKLCANRGFGLLFVWIVVEQHGGEILVNSEKGKGSEFKLRLPQKAL